MAESECCQRRSAALSNMLEWYYRDPVGRTYGPVNSFKLVYLIYSNFFEEDTPFASCQGGRITAADFDPLRKLLPTLQNDFMEYNEDVFACQHYMDSMLHAPDDAVDSEIREVEVLPPSVPTKQYTVQFVERTDTIVDVDDHHMLHRSSDSDISATEPAGDQVFDEVPMAEPSPRETHAELERQYSRVTIPSLEDYRRQQPPVAAYHQDYTFGYNGQLNTSRHDLHSDIAIPVRLDTGAYMDAYHGVTSSTAPFRRGRTGAPVLDVTREPVERHLTANYGRTTDAFDMSGSGYTVPNLHEDDRETAALGSMPTSVILPSTAAPSEEPTQQRIVKRTTKSYPIIDEGMSNGISHKAEEAADTPAGIAEYGMSQLSPIGIPPPNIKNWLSGDDTPYIPLGALGQLPTEDHSSALAGKSSRHDPVAERSAGSKDQRLHAGRSAHLSMSLASVDAGTQTRGASESRLAQSWWREDSATHHDASYNAHIPRPPGVFPSTSHSASMYNDGSNVPKTESLMPAHHMLIKQRLQSNLRETQAHLSRIPSRKISHVLSQSHGKLFMDRSLLEDGV
ncbi:hypothetical protein, conserved [Babesia bigemina]|uniref:GYF domain-containing protein n=1 Tax=Babesia bigemina TaxID=5866 RepID=A0A061DCF5_BABBI|nr:hypothetical protein, conserved [Babesia bigemina]CDR96679.1 hypothetical protein, conserved [Babesia bigemina]|eukprot:XP_012768865.1 hypothetical protein, conserved [Babesia bigemina]